MTVKKYFLSGLKVFFFFFLVLSSLEAGFYVRDYFRVVEASRIQSDQVRILIISDSVFGDENNKFSLFSVLKNKVQSKTSKKIIFFSASQGANSSAQANSKADEVLNSFKPDLSILLVGNSDYIILDQRGLENISNFKFQLKAFLYKFRVYNFFIFLKNDLLNWLQIQPNKKENNIYRQVRTDKPVDKNEIQNLTRLYEEKKLDCYAISKFALVAGEHQNKLTEESKKCANLIQDPIVKSNIYTNIAQAYQIMKMALQAETYYKLAIQTNPQNINSVRLNAWFDFENQNCQGYISKIQKYFEFMIPERRPLMVLKECLIKEKMEDYGQKYFEKLSLKYPTVKQLTALIAKSLATADDKNHTNIFDDSLYLPDRDFYITKLYYYKKANHRQLANAFFTTRDAFSTLADSDLDISNYQSLISKILKKNSKIFTLQYPNQSNWQVLEAIAPFGDKVNFIGLANIIDKNLSKYSVIDLFEDDFMHLTPLGVEVVAEGLSDEIILNLKLEEN